MSIWKDLIQINILNSNDRQLNYKAEDATDTEKMILNKGFLRARRVLRLIILSKLPDTSVSLYVLRSTTFYYFI